MGIFQIATVAAQGILALARYTLTLGTLCAAVAGYGLAELDRKLFRFGHHRALAVLAGVMAINLALIVGLSQRPSHLGSKFRSISPLMQFCAQIQGVGKFLRPQMQARDGVLIDNYNDETNLLAVVIGLPLLAGERAFMAFDENGTDRFPYMKSYQPRFAILSERGIIGPRLGLPPTCSASWFIQGMEFRCLCENEIYRVYEITYGHSSSRAPPGDSEAYSPSGKMEVICERSCLQI